MTDIRIFDTLDELYSAGARFFLKTAVESLRRQDRFSVALSGGSTPLPLYQRLAVDQEGGRLDWEKVHFFWGDERAVAPDHPDSNYRGVLQTLLAPRGIPVENIHRIEGEYQPEIAAGNYERDLLDWFGELPPRFDLILLGMGDDGHTASLFPGTSLVKGTSTNDLSWVDAVQVPRLESWRITFTPRLINAAAQVLFLVVGANKAKTLRAVIKGSYQPDILPAQLIQPENGKLTWLIDKDAAAELGS
jgi:6-phosphogluconolactonase